MKIDTGKILTGLIAGVGAIATWEILLKPLITKGTSSPNSEDNGQ